MNRVESCRSAAAALLTDPGANPLSIRPSTQPRPSFAVISQGSLSTQSKKLRIHCRAQPVRLQPAVARAARDDPRAAAEGGLPAQAQRAPVRRSLSSVHPRQELFGHVALALRRAAATRPP
ncbi:MAG: hypothetical protein F4213_19460 [Boseongicola sp. SB0677_bin_26]|nr:hypothetical protein [Boseongicola sp. SB0665_bin_10]MYG28168.1 hypothetical protein [Boseongicola sp. SB0677_bin_26]